MKAIRVIKEMIAEYQEELNRIHVMWEAASDENRGTVMVKTQERITVLNERIETLTKCKNAWEGMSVSGIKD